MTDPRTKTVPELRRWAYALAWLAQAPQPVARPMLELLGRRPYAFERNPQRWPDDLYHLVDRDYDEWKGIVLTLEQLQRAGVVTWHDSDAVQVAGGGIETGYLLLDDVFVHCGPTIHYGPYLWLSRVLHGVLREIETSQTPGKETP